MKQKRKLFLVAGFCALGSFAFAKNVDAIDASHLNIINDNNATNTVTLMQWNSSIGDYDAANIEYSSVYNFINRNPDTIDNVSAKIAIAVSAISGAAVLLFSKSRRGLNKRSCLLLALSGIGLLTGILELLQDNETFADSEVKTIRIKDKAFYNAFKACFAEGDGYSGSTKSPGASSVRASGSYSYKDYLLSDYYNCSYYGDDDIIFDDAAQTVTLVPEELYSLDIHSRGVSDISDLLNFKDLEYFYAYDNDISDVSILNAENFPHLDGYTTMDFNRIPDLNNPTFFDSGTLFTQTVDIEFDENGNAKLPGIFFKGMDYFLSQAETYAEHNSSYDINSFVIPVHVHNLELNQDLSSVHVLNPSDRAYLSYSIEEISQSVSGQMSSGGSSQNPRYDDGGSVLK